MKCSHDLTTWKPIYNAIYGGLDVPDPLQRDPLRMLKSSVRVMTNQGERDSFFKYRSLLRFNNYVGLLG